MDALRNTTPDPIKSLMTILIKLMGLLFLGTFEKQVPGNKQRDI